MSRKPASIGRADVCGLILLVLPCYTNGLTLPLLPQLLGDTGQSVRSLVQHVVRELRLQEPLYRLADSLAEVDPEAEASLLEGETLLLEEGYLQHHSRAGEVCE